MILPAPLDSVDAALSTHFAHQPLRASLSFVGVEPIEVLRFEPIPDERAYLSLGMSRRPMTAADAEVVTGDDPRAELMLHLRDPADEFRDAWRRLALLAAAPSVEGVVYRVGMTVDLGEPIVPGSACTGVVVIESPMPPIPSAAGRVEVLQVVPATS
ncbi:MAG: suppressor of fused domain protein, partial [Jatrophihabitantaceae bacterium]